MDFATMISIVSVNKLFEIKKKEHPFNLFHFILSTPLLCLIALHPSILHNICLGHSRKCFRSDQSVLRKLLAKPSGWFWARFEISIGNLFEDFRKPQLLKIVKIIENKILYWDIVSDDFYYPPIFPRFDERTNEIESKHIAQNFYRIGILVTTEYVLYGTSSVVLYICTVYAVLYCLGTVAKTPSGFHARLANVSLLALGTALDSSFFGDIRGLIT